MSMKPAILRGTPTFTKPFAPYRTIGEEERNAAVRVIEKGMLSGFIGACVPEFYGGEKVRELEKNWAEYFGVKHAVAMNSATSGLYASVGALGIEPGDEVIVTPTTMTATVTGIVLYQAIPVFADICPHTFCIDPKSVEKHITDRTKAIIGVNIYGESAHWDALRRLAQKYGLKLIEDAAQSIGGTYNGVKSGTLGDIGVYSLNRHKHVHCGEGGVCVTNNDELAERLQLIRNHGEAVVGDKGTKNIVNIIGFNYRMTEIEAAISNEQLKKLAYFVEQRRSICQAIIEVFSSIRGIIPPIASPLSKKEAPSDLCRPPEVAVKHIYYYLCFKIDREVLGISRKAFVKAMNEEGIPLREGGYQPVYFQPMYQKKTAFGRKGHPFKAPYYGREIDYSHGICPVAERMWFEELFYFPGHSFVPTFEEISRFREAAEKVLEYKDEIEQQFGTLRTTS